MLQGEKVSLRARLETDVAVLHAELYDDVETRSRTSERPWGPIGALSASPFAVRDLTEQNAPFSVLRRADGALAGTASLWGIDAHNRLAHVGISLRPAFRSAGLGTDALRVLCHYGFVIRGLQRIQLETLADNQGMLRSAATAGFVHEGVLRRSAWINGTFIDEVIMGLLATEWRAP